MGFDRSSEDKKRQKEEAMETEEENEEEEEETAKGLQPHSKGVEEEWPMGSWETDVDADANRAAKIETFPIAVQLLQSLKKSEWLNAKPQITKCIKLTGGNIRDRKRRITEEVYEKAAVTSLNMCANQHPPVNHPLPANVFLKLFLAFLHTGKRIRSRHARQQTQILVLI